MAPEPFEVAVVHDDRRGEIWDSFQDVLDATRAIDALCELGQVQLAVLRVAYPGPVQHLHDLFRQEELSRRRGIEAPGASVDFATVAVYRVDRLDAGGLGVGKGTFRTVGRGRRRQSLVPLAGSPRVVDARLRRLGVGACGLGPIIFRCRIAPLRTGALELRLRFCQAGGSAGLRRGRGIQGRGHGGDGRLGVGKRDHLVLLVHG